MAPWPNARHLLQIRYWLLELQPNAGLALRLAALTHDAERNFPEALISPLIAPRAIGPTGTPIRPAPPRSWTRGFAGRTQTWTSAMR